MMKCPRCDEKTHVIDSRKKNGIRRRRECTKCKYRFTTREKVEVTEN